MSQKSMCVVVKLFFKPGLICDTATSKTLSSSILILSLLFFFFFAVNNNVLSLEDKPEQQPREAPVINSSDPCSLDVQQSIASPHLPDEDSLRDIEDSTSFSPNEVSTKLRMLKYPGRFVLTCLDDALIGARRRGELSLAEPIVKTFIPLLEELARGVVSTDPGLHSYATKVAREWVSMMGASVEKSELEVWAFLQFIVAFGLRIQPDQNLQLASRVTLFKQAPRLFQSLGLSDAIPSKLNFYNAFVSFVCVCV